MPWSHPTCQISTCCLSVSTLVPSLLLDPHSIVQSRKKEECYFPEVSSKDTVTVAYMCHRNKRDSIWYMIWYACVYVCLCVHCVFFLSAPEGCPSCQSYSVCAALWTEACSGRNLGRHSAPLKSFAQTRQSGTKARVQRNTRACAAVRVCLTELVRESKREERRTGTCGHRLRCFGVQVISIAYCNYCNLWSRVMAEIWVSWQTVALVVLCVHVCACLRTSFQVDAADGL